MTKFSLRRAGSSFVIAIVFLNMSAANLFADNLWSVQKTATAELIVADQVPSNYEAAYLAGVRLELEPGWKTYWRMPGDSGIPPLFDWKASKNLKSAHVLYPAPKRYKDLSGESIVYDKEIVFPVLITPKNPEEPVSLALNFSYGLCKDYCMPGQSDLTLDIAPRTISSPHTTALIKSFLSKVPVKTQHVSSAVSSPNVPTVEAISPKLNGADPHVEIAVKFPEQAEKRDLFVEGDSELYIPMAKHHGETSSGAQIYRINLDGFDNPQSLRGKTIRITATSTIGHSETAGRID